MRILLKTHSIWLMAPSGYKQRVLKALSYILTRKKKINNNNNNNNIMQSQNSCTVETVSN